MNGSYAMTTEAVEEFRRDGCGVLRGVLSAAEIARHGAALREYVLRIKSEGAGIDASPFGNVATREVRTAYNLADAPADVRTVVTSPRLGEIAARALGVDSVRVLHFTGHFKPSGASATPWHQDLAYLPLDTNDVVSLWIALTDVDADMGPLVFAAGSHHAGPLERFERGGDFRLVQSPPMRAGDVSMHAGWTMHAALANRSTRDREAVTICYYRDGARIAAGRNPIGTASFMAGCFAGLAAGDLAAGSLNPVVFRRNM